MSQRTKGMLRMVSHDAWLTIVLVARAADRFRHVFCGGRVSRYSTITTIREQKSRRLCCPVRCGVQLSACSDQGRCVVNPEAGQFGRIEGWMILAGNST
ncbi:hypothetical protein [Pantoea stewartii]|uniref:hypothetical protein n=1 Tax=Pantoea stewartii TaxID=66269 RepID=UPI0025A2D46E|nr:hypothetical protein [Pantoea stewartii]